MSVDDRTDKSTAPDPTAKTVITDPDVLPPWPVAIPLGLQHVLAMFASNLTPAILIGSALDMSPGDRTMLVQAALLCAGLATLLQTIGIGPIGGRLPIMMGSGFAFIAVAIPLAVDYGIAAICGAILVTAVVQVVIALNVHRIAAYFPPVVTGTIILIIGLGLLPTGLTLAAGGNAAIGTDAFGSWKNLGVATLVLVISVGLNRFGRGIWSMASVLIGLVVGYAVAIPLGMTNFSGVGAADVVAVPNPFHFGMSFEVVAIVSFAVIGVVNMVDSVGTVHAVTQAGAGRRATKKEMRGGILAEGSSAAIGSVFGALPTTMFSQNIGLIGLTRVMSRHVVTIGAVVLVGMALLPKAAAVFSSVPSAVLGGGVILLFGMVCAIGIEMLTENGLDQRALIIVALSLSLGRGIASVPGLFDNVAGEWAVVFESGILVGAFVAVVLNLILPPKFRLAPLSDGTETETKVRRRLRKPKADTTPAPVTDEIAGI